MTIKANGTEIQNGSAATWKSGANTVTVEVSAEGEEMTYTVTVTKTEAVR